MMDDGQWAMDDCDCGGDDGDDDDEWMFMMMTKIIAMKL